MPREQEDRRNFDPHSSAFALYAHKMRRYRERDGLSQPDVAKHCIVSPKLISAIENMRRLPTDEVSKRLDTLHTADFFEDQYFQIRREMDLTPGFFSYAEQEDQAASVYTYEPLMIPGLLQNEAYAREVLGVGSDKGRLEEMVALRLGRQDKLEGAPPTFLVAVIKESVLRETAPGSEVMAAQLAHLIEIGERHNIEIQVLPTGARIYVSGAFTLLKFMEGNDLGYSEGAVGQGRLVEEPAVVHRMAVKFEQIRSQALHAPGSMRLIRSIMEGL
ncbi:helix-turn-helix domain-containing protein [Actinomadura macrotermitis]|uniref:HTH cro/C1-type domain-containing protein n=1 Tax=Actinomadura macrotermitis TaxID=2585200 RepID=A0A7K0C728_9ACTN|nr:helix-turn-helix transcriptional regulator [Actinomadura macrotermitis]MQY09279.1 hypothetical protein [Actinomadura macrotermitis]